MGEINVDVQLLGDEAVRISRLSGEINDTLQQIKGQVEKINSVWKSDAQNKLSDNYKTINNKADDFYHDLVSYGDFLKKTAEEYGYVEKKISSNAEQFID